MSRRCHRARLRRWGWAPNLAPPQPEAPVRVQSSGANRPLHVALVVAALFVGALVVELFPFAQRESDLCLSPLEVKLERNQRQSLPLDCTDHLPDLLPMQQKLPRP